MTHLGRQVQMRRESKGWTRTELARRAGLVSDSHLRLIEEGRRADPQASTVVKLAKALGVTPNDLLLEPLSLDDRFRKLHALGVTSAEAF